MKRFIFFVFILATSGSKAQKSSAPAGNDAILNRSSELMAFRHQFTGNDASMDQNIQAYFSSTLSQLANPLCHLKFKSKHISATAVHYVYAQTYMGKDVFGSELKVSVDRAGNLICACNGLFTLPLNSPAVTPDSWFFDGKNLIPCMVKKEQQQVIVTGESGELLYTEDLNKYLFPPDTSVQAKVFLPDPLTSAQVPYGSPYIDSNDLDVSVLNAQRQQVTLRVDFENDTFRLRNRYFLFMEFSQPAFEPVVSTTPVFDFTRSQSGFEDVNIFYHLNMYRNHLDSIGYSYLIFDSMQVDAHALGTFDNSMYSTYNGKPAMYYGVGGVDDGEDADVIIHEYTHSIIDKATEDDNLSTERLSIDEAISDYMAAAYSKRFSQYNWKQVYNWDGNNPAISWFGRNVGTNKTYPYDGSKSYYWNSEIFSGALADLDDRIGSVLTEKILLEAISFMPRTATMKQMCSLMLIADSMLFAKANHFPVQLAFYQRKIIDQMTGIPFFESGALHMRNAASFANGSGDLFISYDGANQITVTCFDITGQEVMTKKTFATEAVIPSGLFTSGVYILHIQVNGMVHPVKIIRY